MRDHIRTRGREQHLPEDDPHAPASAVTYAYLPGCGRPGKGVRRPLPAVSPDGETWHYPAGATGRQQKRKPDMRTRPVSTLIATALTALVVAGGTAGAVLAAAPWAHAATTHSTTVPHNAEIRLDSHCFICKKATTTI